MGQSHWAGACALATALWCSSLAAQEIRPDAYVAGPQRTEAARRIERALAEPLRTPLEFDQSPLNTITGIIEDEYDIPIVFDTAALDAVAVSPDVEVSININNVTLRSALELMLSNVEDLTYIIDDEVLLITTEDEAATRLQVRVYRVDDLVCVTAGDGPRALDEDRFQSLQDIIVSTVEHDSWEENGTGEGEILGFPPGMFVVSQTQRVHDQIAEVLAEVRVVKAEIDATSPPVAVTAQPVTRSFEIESKDFTETPEARSALHQAILRSSSWETDRPNIDEDDVLLEVLPHRVIVRHLPSVVREVERALISCGALADSSMGPFGTPSQRGFEAAP
jgi:hypothetical protein